jgi:hypothetical protein
MANKPYNSTFEAQFDADRAQDFIIRDILRGVHTFTLVEVLAVRPTAGKVGFVDVQPMVLEQDTNNVVIAQSPIYNIPYMRVQGGMSAVICDPTRGDIGLCSFAERDITNVIATQQPGAAPTDRTHSSADGVYMGGALNRDPTQWVKFLPDGGIDITTTGNVTVNAAGSATVTATSAVIKAASIKLQNAGTALLSLLNSTFAAWAAAHTHTAPQGGNTGPPTSAPPAAGQTSVVQAE